MRGKVTFSLHSTYMEMIKMSNCYFVRKW